MRNIVNRALSRAKTKQFSLLTLLLLFTMGIGQMWGVTATPTPAGTYAIGSSKPGGQYRFLPMQSGSVYNYRMTNSSYGDDGMKLKGNDNAVIVYLGSSMSLTATCTLNKNNKGENASFTVYTIAKASFDAIINQETTYPTDGSSRTVEISTTGTQTSFTVSISSTASKGTFTGSPASALPAGYYYIVGSTPSDGNGNVYFTSITLTAAAKTDPTITFNNGAYSVGSTALDLSSLFSSNSDGAVTYSVKTDGSTNASISGTNFTATAAGTAVVTASQAATSTYNAATKDANIVVTVPSTPTHNITYTNTKGATNTNPATYYQGTGVAEFEPLADVDGFHFTGWSPVSISADATTDQTIEAQWVAAYNVTFSAGTGSGDVPAGFQKWEGAKFNLPGQGSMVAPTGKGFDGWKANGAGDKLAAGSEYTMGSEAVEFVAQWKNVPQTIFHWRNNHSSGDITEDKTTVGTTTGGTMKVRISNSKKMSPESATYHSSVPSDMKDNADGKELKPNSNSVFLELTLSSGKFQEGDTIYVTGFNRWIFSTTETFDPFDVIGDSIVTGSSKTDVRMGYQIIAEGVNTSTIYARRGRGETSAIAAIKVVRPAAKDVKNTVHSLTDVKVGETSISESNLATLLSAHSVNLDDELNVAPTITFNKHTVITYDDDSQKETDTPIAVTATDNGAGKWTASTTINDVVYTVTTVKVTGYAVTYHAPGATGDVPTDVRHESGVEVTVLGNTGDLARTLGGESAAFHGWNTKADMSGTYYAANAKFTMPAADVDLYAVWGFAINYNLDGGTINDANPASWYVSTGAASEISTSLPSDVTKDNFTFVGWYTENGNGTKVTSINAEYTGDFDGDWALKAIWKPGYASSINIEQWVLDNGKDDAAFQALVATKGYTLNNVNSLDSLDDTPGKSNRNYAYLGQKLKAAGASISFTLKAGKTVKVRIGNVGADFKIYVGETPTTYTADDLRNTKPTDSKEYTYTATTEDVDIKIENVTKDKTLVIKQIMIDNDIAPITLPWKVTYNFNDGETPTTNTVTWTGSALILPNATAPEDCTFAGWYDELLGGELVGAAGASYTPTDNVTLYAHYAPVEYAINYDEGDHGQTAIVVASAGWGTEYTAIANPFTPETGYIFAGWEVTGVPGVPTLADGGSFTMPKNEVTLTALWEDNSKVAVVVETNEKFETLAAAIAAAEPGYTVQLIQDIEQATGVAIAKNLVLDLNGHTFTCTDGANVNSRAIKITAGDVTVKNGTIAAVTTANFEGGCYGAFRIEGATANVTLRDLTMTNGRHYGLGIKLVNGHLDMEDCTVTSINGAGGLEVGTGTALVKNCTFTQSGFENAHAWIATCLATCYMGNLEVQGGTYTSEHYVLYVYSSGGAMDVKSGTFEGDIRTAMDLNSYPTAEGSIEIEGGSFQGVGGAEINFAATTAKDEISISAGTFNTPIENQYCAEGYVPSAEVAPGVYTVVPKDGVEIIGVVVTGNTEGTVSGLYKGTATVNLNDKKIDSGKYIYVTLKEGYTFEENDVLIVDVNTKSNLDGGNKALEITTGVGNIDGDVWKSIAFDDYNTGENIIPLTEIAAGQTSIGLKRSANQNAKINGLRVLRPMKPMLTAITIDERAGEIDPLDDKHFNVLIPFESDLAALTVVPTIVSNTAEADVVKTVESNGGEWVLGNNTYRVTDKDGDYTDYTITLTRDVKKYTVTFEAQGGSAVEPKLVVAGEKLAAAPADPTREDYQFLGWAETTAGEVVDVTDIIISANKKFYAQWKYEDPIVMLDGDGHIDHDNFLTGLNEGTVNFGGADHNCVSFGSTNSTIVGKTGANKFIVYNAKTNKTRIKFVLYNKQNSPKNLILQKLAEGETETTDVVIEVPSKQLFTTEYYTYNSDDNRTMYVCSENTDIKVLQVKVIESGTPVKQAGEAGYSLNFNVGRVFAPSGLDVVYDGLAMKASSNYQVLTSEEFPTQSNLSFQVNELVTMTLVSTGAKYKVSKNPAGSGKEYAAGTNKHTLTQGTWYIVSSTGSNMKFTNISFEEPVADHTRDNLNPSFLGTLCWTNDAILGGGTLYEFAGKDEHNYLVFDEVEENRLEAGKPYIFMPENGNTEIKVYNIDESDPKTESDLQPVNNMYGTLDGKTLVPGVDDNMYYFSSNHIWAVKDFTVNIPILPNRCYIDYPAVLAADPAPAAAPGRRRVTMGVNGQNTATGVDEIEASETPMKVMINGQIFIIRGEKMFDATGRLVK